MLELASARALKGNRILLLIVVRSFLALKIKYKTAAPARSLADDYLGNLIKLRETLDMTKLPVFTTERLILREVSEAGCARLIQAI